MDAFRIIRATISDRPRVASFLREAFYKHEPLYIALGLTEPIEADINQYLENLSEGKSLIALSRTNKVLGVAINSEVTKHVQEKRQELLNKCECKHFAKILKFDLHVERTGSFWKYIDEPKAFDLGLLAVDPSLTGQGIGKTLLMKSEVLAKEVGYKVFRIVCTSYYSAKLAERQGLTCMFQMKYEDYRDENGEVVFKVAAPHTAIKVYVRKFET